jgi:mannose-6-phosphate isomerase
MMKLLDAHKTLSVQVHPDDVRAARLDPPDGGKTEAWCVLEATPESLVYAGLKSGVDRNELTAAIREGQCQECLHAFHPSPGDCLFIPAGTVHCLGAGLVVAEIQQSSDVTYRLFDWNRVGSDGKTRPLHVEQALECIDFARGPVEPQQPRAITKGNAKGTVPFSSDENRDSPHVSRLVECEKFIWDRWEFDGPISIGDDDRCHIITVIQGAVEMEGDPSGSDLPRGGTALLPASAGSVSLRPRGKTILLDAYLP